VSAFTFIAPVWHFPFLQPLVAAAQIMTGVYSTSSPVRTEAKGVRLKGMDTDRNTRLVPRCLMEQRVNQMETPGGFDRHRIWVWKWNTPRTVRST